MNKEIKLVNNVYDQISQMIELRKHRAKIMVNSEIIAMNWSIGKCLQDNVLKGEKGEYGQKVIAEIGRKLSSEYGNGFNKSTLFRMIQFYNEFPDVETVATLSQQLSWSHFVELLPIKDKTKRDFYTIMCINENWDVRKLRERKKSMLFERTLISKKPENTIKNDLVQLSDKKKMSIDLFLKDPYVLDFLDLKNTFSEKDLENAILVELEHFILEMGTDFAFLARQKHFILDNKDYYIDLLFYHRTLRRLVMIELKLGEFEPDYKGQVELYLKWLDKNERAKGEEPPLALILCAEKSDETIKLMDLDKGNIRVAQYLTKLPPKDLLEKKLKMAIDRAKGILDNKKK